MAMAKLDNNGYWQFPVRIKEKEGTVICLSTDKFCPDCEGTGYTEHDAGGGNSYKLACEYCGGKGEIEKET